MISVVLWLKINPVLHHKFSFFGSKYQTTTNENKYLEKHYSHQHIFLNIHYFWFSGTKHISNGGFELSQMDEASLASYLALTIEIVKHSTHQSWNILERPGDHSENKTTQEPCTAALRAFLLLKALYKYTWINSHYKNWHLTKRRDKKQLINTAGYDHKTV